MGDDIPFPPSWYRRQNHFGSSLRGSSVDSSPFWIVLDVMVVSITTEHFLALSEGSKEVYCSEHLESSPIIVRELEISPRKELVK